MADIGKHALAFFSQLSFWAACANNEYDTILAVSCASDLL